MAVCFWPVDDCRNPAAIVEAVSLVREGADVVRFPWVRVDRQQDRSGVIRQRVDIFDRDHEDNLDPTLDFCLGPFVVFSRSVFDRFGLFDEQFRVVGDYEWQLRVASQVEFVSGETISGVFFSSGANLSGSPRLWVEQNVLFARYNMPREPWPLDSVSAALMETYTVPPSPDEIPPADWSFEHAEGRRRLRQRLRRKLRRVIGRVIRSVR
jgi:hypothetical protein